MGLDMYLKAHKYIGGNFDHLGITGNISIVSKLKAFNGGEDGPEKPVLELDDMSKVSEIIFQAAYWRKANQVHSWFVENCQNGVDECQRAYVSRGQLEELRNLCKEVLESKGMAVKLLPPNSGFFFGSTEIDEWYWEDLESTVTMLESILDDELFTDCSFYYQSSW